MASHKELELISKDGRIGELFAAMGLEYESGYDVSPTFSTKPPRIGWQATFFETESGLAIYHLATKEKSISSLRPFVGGIKTDHFVIVASLKDHDCMFIKNFRKGNNTKYHTFSLRKDSEYNRAIAVFRKYSITTDILTAHAGLANILNDMDASNESFTNRGLFSTYYLENRMLKDIERTKRKIPKESVPVLNALRDSKQKVVSLLHALGYDLQEKNGGYSLLINGTVVSSIIVTDRANLDVKYGEGIPSMQAVTELSNNDWVMLTNGRIWRMYSSKVSSSSTDYFEIDLDQVDDEKDMRLQYFVAIFGALSLRIINGISQLDYIHEESVTHASELEDDMRSKIFDGDMFVMLVRGVLDHDLKTRYDRAELDDAKTKAIRILYRLLFILYAESRVLLPVDHSKYKKVSMLSMRDGLDSFQKEEEACSCWDNLKVLFSGISKGNPELNLPEYNGKLFEKSDIDSLSIRNHFLVPVIRDMTERKGESVDYQSLGVRHLGSIYESLLEYDVVQAERDMVIIDNVILEADFAADISEKPDSYIQKNDIYLSTGGLARKGTGSYFTPEPIVKNLVKSGLQPIFDERTKRFESAMRRYRGGDKNAAKQCNSLMLDLQVLDPAMGSGHFLVVVTDAITRWIMSLISRYPDAPIAGKIDKQREKVIETQKKKGVHLNADLLTPNSILKRMVMKNCVYGTDINELSVELTKLSMWLDSFTIGMPLTVLGHHIRHGNSLIGMYTNMQDNGTLDSYMEQTMESGGQILQEISQMSDIIPEEIKHDESLMAQFFKQNTKLRRQFDAICAHIVRRSEGTPSESDTDSAVKKHAMFHWQLEFPDAFTDARPGFDLIIGNPPWEAVEPHDDEFFSKYDPNFRAHSNKQDKNKIKTKLLEQQKDIKTAFEHYENHIKEQSRFFKDSEQYKMRKGKSDMWQLFLERMIGLLAKEGRLSVVVPSGILTNDGAKKLRETLLEMQIISIYEFENGSIFPEVDSRYKFVLLTIASSKPKPKFNAAFYLHDIAALDHKTEQEKFVKMPIEIIRLTSPSVLAIPEVRSLKDIEILNQIYNDHKYVRDGLDGGKYTIEFVTELNRTNASQMFKRDGRGWPLIEGKNFHQFIPDYTGSKFTIESKEGLTKTEKVGAYQDKNKQIHEEFRMAFRNVASSTNIRTMISCIIPPHRFFAHSSPTVVLHHNKNLLLNNDLYNKKILYLTAIFNSMTFDYLIRLNTNMNMSFFIINNVAVPDNTQSKLAQQITKLSSILTMQHEDFSKMAKRLQTSVKKLDMRQRIESVARLDALVAHHYGLDRKQYEHIIGTFGGNRAANSLDVDEEEIEWNDATIRAFNHEVRKHVLAFYDKYISG